MGLRGQRSCFLSKGAGEICCVGDHRGCEVVHTYGPSTAEAEEGKLRVPGQPGGYSETIPWRTQLGSVVVTCRTQASGLPAFSFTIQFTHRAGGTPSVGLDAATNLGSVATDHPQRCSCPWPLSLSTIAPKTTRPPISLFCFPIASDRH